MKTTIKVDSTPEYRRWVRHYRALYWAWKLLGKRSDFSDNYQRFTANKQRGCLTPEQVKTLTSQQGEEDCHFAERSKEAITDASTGSRFEFAFLLRDFLRARPDIKTIANVGARVDLWCAYLAPIFPDRTFLSVDFQPNLERHNSLLPQAPNWRFMPGYWHELDMGADLYFSISTSVLMNNVELNTYLDLPAKAFAFCEGWWPRADRIFGGVVLPEDVPKEGPYCSGAYANYHHNYIAKLEERGFKVRTSELVPYSDAFHYLQLIAERH